MDEPAHIKNCHVQFDLGPDEKHVPLLCSVLSIFPGLFLLLSIGFYFARNTVNLALAVPCLLALIFIWILPIVLVRRVRLNEGGVSMSSPINKCDIPWSSLKRVVDYGRWGCILQDSKSGIFIPGILQDYDMLFAYIKLMVEGDDANFEGLASESFPSHGEEVASQSVAETHSCEVELIAPAPSLTYDDNDNVSEEAVKLKLKSSEE